MPSHRLRILGTALLACAAMQLAGAQAAMQLAGAQAAMQLAGAQAASPPPGAASAPAAGTAPLVLFNRQVIVFHQPAAGFSAADRAAMAEGRIRALLRRGGPGE